MQKTYAYNDVRFDAAVLKDAVNEFSKIIGKSEGVEGLSNLDGVQYIPFAKGNIRETFGDVLATIRREFPA